MMHVGPLLDEIFNLTDADRDEALQARIWRQLNYQYFELCAEVSWAALRAGPVTLDFAAAADTTGLWLPSDLLGIDLVWDADDEVEFFEQGRATAQTDENGYRYFRYLPSRTALYSGSDLVLAKGASSFTSAALTVAGTAVNGEYVQFDDEPGFYQISSATTPFTFTPAYHGPAKTQKSFCVRPWETSHKLVIVDPDETKLVDRDVSVYYWRMPVPLYRREDMILLPSVEVLKMRTLRALPESKSKFGVSQSMMDEAFRRAVKANPKVPRPLAARDKHGMKIDLATNPFDER